MLSALLKKAVVVPIVGAVVVAGGIAFAEDLVEQPTTEESTTEEFTTEESTTEEEVTEEEVAEEEVTENSGHPEDTHGAAVSQLARETPPGPDHGRIVSELARSKSKGHGHGPPSARGDDSGDTVEETEGDVEETAPVAEEEVEEVDEAA